MAVASPAFHRGSHASLWKTLACAKIDCKYIGFGVHCPIGSSAGLCGLCRRQPAYIGILGRRFTSVAILAVDRFGVADRVMR